MKFTLLIGRTLFSLMFLITPLGNFSSPVIQYSSAAGVPFASFLVPLSGVLAFFGAASIILDTKLR